VIGNNVGTNCPQVEMVGESGKSRKTLAANTEQVLRIVQSISSPKAEPSKLWIAAVGSGSAPEFPQKRRGDASGFAGDA